MKVPTQTNSFNPKSHLLSPFSSQPRGVTHDRGDQPSHSGLSLALRRSEGLAITGAKALFGIIIPGKH